MPNMYNCLYPIFAALSQKEVKITILRTREVSTSDRQSAYMVDCEVDVGGQVIEQGVFPQLNDAEIMAQLPTPQGPKYSIMASVNVMTSFDLRKAFRIRVSDLGVRVADFSSISSAIQSVISVNFTGMCALCM